MMDKVNKMVMDKVKMPIMAKDEVLKLLVVAPPTQWDLAANVVPEAVLPEQLAGPVQVMESRRDGEAVLCRRPQSLKVTSSRILTA